MKITLEQHEIEAALEAHCSTLNLDKLGRFDGVTFDFVDNDELEAQVTITADNASKPRATSSAPKKRTRRTKEQIEADEAAAKAEAEADKTDAAEKSEEVVEETKAEEEATPVADTKAEDDSEAEPEVKHKAPEKAKKNPQSIFA